MTPTSAATAPGVVAARTIADRILERVRAKNPLWGTYALDLTLDAMLEYFLASGDVQYRDFVFTILKRRRIGDDGLLRSGSQPFGHLDYAIYRCTGDPGLLSLIVGEAQQLRTSVDRSPDGLVLHRNGRKAPPRVLVDFMQDYIARMARAGALTEFPDYWAEAEAQTRRHRDLLRDPTTGLWRQGRGWDPTDPNLLSPGAWSRGQGWVLRGLIDALAATPHVCATRHTLIGCLVELLEALALRQDGDGFWHCLVDRPPSDSKTETSGTALIAAALYRSIAEGYIDAHAFRPAADRAFDAIARKVDADGRVSGACAGPGPLNRQLMSRYIGLENFREAEDHGWFSVLYACAARHRLAAP